MADPLDTAAAGDRILGADLQASIELLKGLADALDDALTDGVELAQMQAVARLQARLRELAGALADRQIDLLAGEARVGAVHIDAAVSYANGVIKATTDLKSRLGQVAALLDFFGTVTTGSGTAIVQAAVTLKSKLG